MTTISLQDQIDAVNDAVIIDGLAIDQAILDSLKRHQTILAQQPIGWGRQDTDFRRSGKWSFTNSSGMSDHTIAVYAMPPDAQVIIDTLKIKLDSSTPLEWTNGIPKGHIANEWFLAKLDTGHVVALKSLPEEWSYDYTTADETYYKADRISKWMQLPNTEYLTPSAYYEKQIKELTAERDALAKELADVKKCYDGACLDKAALSTEILGLHAELVNKVPESWTNLLAYVLQDDLHNRLTPRVIDIAYSAFMLGKQPNKEDGGESDWFTDTKPTIAKAIALLKKDLIEECGAYAVWQPIETAPKDGTEILLYSLNDIGLCYWRDDFVMQGWTWGLEKRFNNPTHWMPLPKAPQ